VKPRATAILREKLIDEEGNIVELTICKRREACPRR